MFDVYQGDWEQDAERLGIVGDLRERLVDFYGRLDRFLDGSALARGETLVSSLAIPSQGSLECDGPILKLTYVFRGDIGSDYCPLFWINLGQMELNWYHYGRQRSDQVALGGERVGLLSRLSDVVTAWINNEPEQEGE